MCVKRVIQGKISVTIEYFQNKQLFLNEIILQLFFAYNSVYLFSYIIINTDIFTYFHIYFNPTPYVYKSRCITHNI